MHSGASLAAPSHPIARAAFNPCPGNALQPHGRRLVITPVWCSRATGAWPCRCLVWSSNSTAAQKVQGWGSLLLANVPLARRSYAHAGCPGSDTGEEVYLTRSSSLPARPWWVDIFPRAHDPLAHFHAYSHLPRAALLLRQHPLDAPATRRHTAPHAGGDGGSPLPQARTPGPACGVGPSGTGRGHASPAVEKANPIFCVKACSATIQESGQRSHRTKCHRTAQSRASVKPFVRPSRRGSYFFRPSMPLFVVYGVRKQGFGHSPQTTEALWRQSQRRFSDWRDGTQLQPGSLYCGVIRICVVVRNHSLVSAYGVMNDRSFYALAGSDQA